MGLFCTYLVDALYQVFKLYDYVLIELGGVERSKEFIQYGLRILGILLSESLFQLDEISLDVIEYSVDEEVRISQQSMVEMQFPEHVRNLVVAVCANP